VEKNVIDASIENLIREAGNSFVHTVGKETTVIRMFDEELVIRVKCHDNPETSVIFNSVEITDDKTIFLSSGKVYGEEFENRNLEYIW
jgi:hypothetical protein